MKSAAFQELKKKINRNLKKYLNSEEVNDFCLIALQLENVRSMLNCTLDNNFKSLAKIRIAWDTRGNLSKDEHKYLKMAETYLNKAYTSIANRLDKQEVTKINKRLISFNLRILDKYTADKMDREAKDKMINAVVPRDQFEDWCEEVMELKCKDCNKNGQACRLHEIFEDNFVQESDWGLENCRYAYNKIEVQNTEMPRVIRKFMEKVKKDVSK